MPPMAKTLLSDRAAIGGKQADRHDRVGEDFDSGVEGLDPRAPRTLCSSARRLQHRFQIDRHRVIARGDHVLLMHVGRGEAVQQREPGAGAAEESRAAVRVGAAGMRDEFGPAIAVARDGADGFQRDRRDRRGSAARSRRARRCRAADPWACRRRARRRRNDRCGPSGRHCADRTDRPRSSATRPAAPGCRRSRRIAGRSASSRRTNSRDVSIHCRVSVAISRNSTGLSSNSAAETAGFHVGDELRCVGAAVARHCRACAPGEALVERRGGRGRTIPRAASARRQARADVSRLAAAAASSRCQSRRSACATTGASSSSNAQGSRRVAASRPAFRPRLAAPPRSRRRRAIQAGGRADMLGRPRANRSRTALERQAVARQPALKQRSSPAGARPAPCGKAARGQIGIAVRRRATGSKSSDKSSSMVAARSRQALVKGIHRDRSDHVAQSMAMRRYLITGRFAACPGRRASLSVAVMPQCNAPLRRRFHARNGRENHAIYLHKSAICHIAGYTLQYPQPMI